VLFGVPFLHEQLLMKLKLFVGLMLAALMVSCSEYQKLLVTTNNELRLERAEAYYNEKKYNKVVELLETYISSYRNSEKGELVLYLVAKSQYNSKKYSYCIEHFENIYRTYPKSQYAEESRFLAAKSAFLVTPDPRLTQEETVKSINMLRQFLEIYPESAHSDEVVKMVQDLQDKLVYKQLLSCRLYFNLGNYMGNNYQSCVVTATNALLDFPVSKYREELMFLILKSKYTLATESIEELKLERYRSTIDEYYTFINENPNGSLKKDADRILKECRKIIKE
jgi:outer membrane protein assembly factor BamD